MTRSPGVDIECPSAVGRRKIAVSTRLDREFRALPNNVIDLRSDTVTHPTDEMRRAMASAEVGDDVFGEDPSINRLEELAAGLMGKEAALFTASGTMSNLIAALTHCRRGDEVVMGSEAHMMWNEVAGAATLAAVQVRTVPNDDMGRIDPQALEEAIRPGGNIQYPPTGLVCLENTHNRCNGGVLDAALTKSLADAAHAHGVSVHLDGARIFNASVALEAPPSSLVKEVDDVSFCLSKGLSAPVGSLLCGSREFVDRARKWRKMIGGGMRQAGVLAAAGIVALDTMIDRLAEDHANARKLAEGLAGIKGLSLDPDMFPTNIIFAHVEPSLGTAQHLVGRLAEAGVLVSHPGDSRVRMVLNRHVGDRDVDEALHRVSEACRQALAAP